jgi:hypothetical protein
MRTVEEVQNDLLLCFLSLEYFSFELWSAMTNNNPIKNSMDNQSFILNIKILYLKHIKNIIFKTYNI